MSDIRKFLFDRSFDSDAEAEGRKRKDKHEEAAEAEAEESEEEEEPPPPTYSEEELEAARAAAFAEGRQQGVDEAAQATERRLAEMLEALGQRAGELLEARGEAADQATRNAVSVAAALTRKVLPSFSRRGALDEIRAMVEEAMERVLEEPRLAIRVSPDLAREIRDKVDAEVARRGYQGKVTVLADEDLPLGDCRIEWDDGGAQRDTAQLWQQIDEIIERHLAEDDAETTPPPAADVVDREKEAAPVEPAAPEQAEDAAADQPFGAGMEGVGAEGMAPDDEQA